MKKLNPPKLQPAPKPQSVSSSHPRPDVSTVMTTLTHSDIKPIEKR